MKETYTKYILCFVLLHIMIVGNACEKESWYDEKADRATATPATLKDLQALLDNNSLMNNFGVSMGEMGTDGHTVIETSTKLLSDLERNAYTWSHEKPYVKVFSWAGSGGGYDKIFCCNLILEQLQKIHPENKVEQQQWNNIYGQARFNRAQKYYELSQVFAPPFQSASASTDLSIPLRLESDINIPSKRSTVKQTYDQIIADLESAKDLLPIKPLYKTRASKPAVLALLARVYLSMEKYDKAGFYSDSCLFFYKDLLDYNTLSTFTNPRIPIFNPEVIFQVKMINNRPNNSNSIIIDSTLYGMYVNNDLRKTIFYEQGVAGIIQFKGTYSGSTIVQFAGLATDEMYLIRAECHARAGNANAAMSDLNTLLRARWKMGTFIDFKAESADDALEQVLIERKKELLLRGLRWSDLRRLNKDERFKQTLTRVVDGRKFVLEPGSYKYTLPIPDDVIQFSGMEQNPGWN